MPNKEKGTGRRNGIVVDLTENKEEAMSYYEEIICTSDSDYSLVLEDDDRVAYAYLIFNGEIVGDVWLYNRGESPRVVDWSNREQMPFLNPQCYTNNECIKNPLSEKSMVEVNWLISDSIKLIHVKIDETLNIYLSNGSKPGWSNNVCLSGPLAKKIEYEKIERSTFQ